MVARVWVTRFGPRSHVVGRHGALSTAPLAPATAGHLVYAQTRLNPALCPTPFLPFHPAVKLSSPLRRQGGSEFKPLNHAVSSLAVLPFSTVDVFIILLWERPYRAR